jgi:hypothetical protein
MIFRSSFLLLEKKRTKILSLAMPPRHKKARKSSGMFLIAWWVLYIQQAANFQSSFDSDKHEKSFNWRYFDWQ